MTTAKEEMDKDFEQMMQMLTGFWVTQIAGAVATYSIADHLAAVQPSFLRAHLRQRTERANLPVMKRDDPCCKKVRGETLRTIH